MRSLLMWSSLVLAAPLAAQQDAALAKLYEPDHAIAQRMMCWTLSRTDAEYELRDRTRELVADLGIGGVVISLGNVDDAASLVRDLQTRAKTPLLIAADFEAGTAYRLDGGTDLGCAMLWGAAGSDELAFEAGRVTGEEAQALGVHLVFGPVLDVNVNPKNPIINTRSFGESPQDVARLGAAFIRGLQSTGLIATAKHFPGHGDVATDSHLALPTVTSDRARLDDVELRPFRAAVDADVGAIMSGHLAVPALGTGETPATFAQPIMTRLLRRELRFGGLIVSDALDMGALNVDSGEAAVRALAAGVDILLMPKQPEQVIPAVKKAVRESRIRTPSPQRIADLKRQLGLLDGRGLPAPDLTKALRKPDHLRVAQRVAEAGMTLVRDPDGRIPLTRPRRLVITLPGNARGEDGTAAFVSRLTTRPISCTALRVDDAADAERAERAMAAADSATTDVVLAIHEHSDAGLQERILAAAQRSRAVVVSFDNPYRLQNRLAEHTTLICGYASNIAISHAVADALDGRLPMVGRLPVSIPGIADRGAGITRLPPQRAELPRSAPRTVGFVPNFENRVRAVLDRGLESRAFPGAVALVARRGQVVCEIAVGCETFAADAPPIRTTSRFDLASLTKVCATTPVTMRLLASNQLSLDTRVAALLSDFGGGDKDRITIRHLLTHTAGLPPFKRFFLEHAGKDAVLAAAKATALDHPPGERYRYSDIGMMLLMACIEAVTEQPFEAAVREHVTGPLGMRHAGFAHSGQPIDAVPTEQCAFRKRLVRGEVHDENAWAMGGISGHAGLFGTADDVARIGLAFLGGGRGWIPAGLAQSAVRQQSQISRRALGWDTASASLRDAGLSATTFCHTGFTGTSVWCDPVADVVVVLLTNRVHPTRDNKRHLAVRTDLARTVMRSLVER